MLVALWVMTLVSSILIVTVFWTAYLSTKYGEQNSELRRRRAECEQTYSRLDDRYQVLRINYRALRSEQMNERKNNE